MDHAEDRDILRERMVQLADPQSDAELPGQPSSAFETAPPLVQPSREELRFAFAANLFDLFRAMGHLPEARIEETEVGARHLAFPASPMFKGVWQVRVSVDEANDAIDDAERWFASHSAPFAFWWVDPRTSPDDLGQRLQRKGWQAWELDAPGMAADLDELAYDAMDWVPSGYRQCRVVDDAGLRDFRQAFVAGFEVPEWAGQAWVDATMAFGVGRAPWQCYVGYLDGEPVASNMLFNGAGVASVFGVATAPRARRQGIGAAITLLAYREARESGYRHGVLFGTESGAPVYRRIGFHDVDATLSRYLWQAG